MAYSGTPLNRVGIGIVGCGNISAAYLQAIAGFPLLDIRGVSDLRPDAAEAAAARHGLKAQSVEDLLRDDQDPTAIGDGPRPPKPRS